MKLIFITFLVLVICKGCAFDNVTPRCVGKPCISKCCLGDEYVGRNGSDKKLCTQFGKKNNNFMNFPIYDQRGEKTDKKIFEEFEVIFNKFRTDEPFYEISVNTLSMRGVSFYLIDSGHLFFEMPNRYVRFVKMDVFCVDLFLMKDMTIQPAFWATRDTDEQTSKQYNFMSGAMLFSCFCLFLVLVVYALLAELRNLCGRILMAYVTCLMFALLLLAVIRIKIHTDGICFRLTLVIYYFFLASFCWMTVMSYDIWWTFRGYAKARPIHRRGENFKFMMYCIYAFGLPMAMTIMLVCVDDMELSDKPWIVKPNLTASCFIEGGEKLLYLYIPMLILIFSNWMFYLMTAFNIWRLSRGTSVLDSAAAGTPAVHRTHRHRFLVYLKLSVVMGLNWVLEVISFIYPDFKGWFISDIYNILIGFSIFLIFVCKKTIFKKLTKLYVRKTQNSWYPGVSSRSNTTSSSESSQETQTLQVCANPKGPGYVINNF